MPSKKIDFNEWTVRALGSFLNAKETPLKHRQKIMKLILEGYARDKPYCWPENATLVERMGITCRPVQKILADLKADGWIKRIPNTDRRDRTGFVLLKRTNDQFLAWLPDRSIEEAAATLGRARARRRPDVRPDAENSTEGTPKTAEDLGAENSAQKATNSTKPTKSKSAPPNPRQEGVPADWLEKWKIRIFDNARAWFSAKQVADIGVGKQPDKNQRSTVSVGPGVRFLHQETQSAVRARSS